MFQLCENTTSSYQEPVLPIIYALFIDTSVKRLRLSLLILLQTSMKISLRIGQLELKKLEASSRMAFGS